MFGYIAGRYSIENLFDRGIGDYSGAHLRLPRTRKRLGAPERPKTPGRDWRWRSLVEAQRVHSAARPDVKEEAGLGGKANPYPAGMTWAVMLSCIAVQGLCTAYLLTLRSYGPVRR